MRAAGGPLADSIVALRRRRAIWRRSRCRDRRGRAAAGSFAARTIAIGVRTIASGAVVAAVGPCRRRRARRHARAAPERGRARSSPTSVPRRCRRGLEPATGGQPVRRHASRQSLMQLRGLAARTERGAGRPRVHRRPPPRSLRRARRPDAESDQRSRATVDSCSSARTRSTPRASKGSSRRCARDTRPSIRRPRCYARRPLRVACRHACRRPATGRRCFTPGGSRISACGRDRPSRVRVCSKMRGRSAAGWTRASASTRRRRSSGCSAGSIRCDRRERFFLTYLPIAGHHPYASSRDPARSKADGDLPAT